jgi:hypothetical protein
MTHSINREAMIQQRGELEARLNELNEERTEIERELLGISLYLDAVNGLLPNTEPAAASNSEPEPKGSAGGRARKGERSGAILDMLRQEPDGYTADKIYELLGVTDIPGKKAVYSTLHYLKNQKKEIALNRNKHFVLLAAKVEAGEPTEALDVPETTEHPPRLAGGETAV